MDNTLRNRLGQMVLCCVWFCLAERGFGAATSPPEVLLNDPVAGQTLAAELRAVRVPERVELRGVMKLKRSGQDMRQVSFVFTTFPITNGWRATYRLLFPDNTDLSRVYAITHQFGSTNAYAVVMEAGTRVAGAAEPLGESDFLLGDLGLEFLHWPQQVLIKKELKRGRACQVLESRPSPTGTSLGYGRVLAWVDTETGGIIQADAYDAAGKALKEFQLNSFKKVDGQWQLEEMQIVNVQDKRRTRLTFELEKKP
ncbi:MAG: outer membrane lipoprotein-sorting protein [Verrucomicrobiota bacterium]